ncbi:hypothetical protein O181_046176 [Austropuccinia psidii MF-1]|uniref:DDE Tnp4 domain-containing protein n=1 Tax=Austropuccinia psidii MF-1 TaxID=1389203 RepID=A0A9Q3DLH2_9BASI|nr:hypothetical protein [Austropuccinia psidii MF-1]
MCALRNRMVELYPIHHCHLLGDSGYALEPWMIVPFASGEEPEAETPEDRFNKDHASDRNCVERCIGLLKAVMRCINDERVMHYDFVKSALIVVAVCVIHNLRVLGNVPHFIGDEENLGNENANEDYEDEVQVVNLLAQGRVARQQIVQELERQRR